MKKLTTFSTLMFHPLVGTWGTPGRRAAVSRSTSEVAGWAKQTMEIRTSNQAREVVELAVDPTPVSSSRRGFLGRHGRIQLFCRRGHALSKGVSRSPLRPARIARSTKYPHRASDASDLLRAEYARGQTGMKLNSGAVMLCARSFEPMGCSLAVCIDCRAN